MEPMGAAKKYYDLSRSTPLGGMTAAQRRRFEERAAIAVDLPSLERQNAVLGPVLSVIEGSLASVETLAGGDEEMVRRVGARRLEGCVDSVASVLESAGVENGIEDLIVWPKGTDPTMTQLEATMDALREFGSRYGEIRAQVASRVQTLQTRDAELARVLLDRLG